MTEAGLDVHARIANLMDTARRDNAGAQELFSYAWMMLCVRRGLMRVVREISSGGEVRLVIEETRTGSHRIVKRPAGLDADLELLAIQAIGRILEAPAS